MKNQVNIEIILTCQKPSKIICKILVIFIQYIVFKKGILGTALNIVIFISFTVLGILIHELGHILGLYLTNSKFTGFSFNLTRFAAVVRGRTYNTQSKVIVIIAGSLLSITSLVLLKLVVIHKKHPYLHLAINTAILNEFLYWSYSAFINYGDANSFLEIVVFNKILFGSLFLIIYIILYIVAMTEFSKEILSGKLKNMRNE